MGGDIVGINGRGKEGGSLYQLPPEACTGFEAVPKDVLMIFSVLASIKEIVAKGRDFNLGFGAALPPTDPERVDQDVSPRLV